MDRTFDRGAPGQMDECPISDKPGVQGDEGILFDGGVIAEVFLNHLAIGFQSGGDAGYFGPAREFAVPAEGGDISAVDKHQFGRGIPPLWKPMAR